MISESGLKGRWKKRIDNFAAAKTGIPEYVPVFAQMHDHAAWVAGVPIKEYFTDPKTFVETTILVTEYYQLEFPMLVYDAYNIEAEALGQRLRYRDQAMPEIDFSQPLIRKPSDLINLKSPDPYRDGRMPFVLEANRIFRELTGLSPNLSYCGPLTLAIQIRGYEQFITDIRTDPDFAHDLLAFLTEEVLAPWIHTLRREAGNSLLVIGVEAWASLPLVTMDILREFFVPYVKRLQQLCGEVQVPVGGLWGESYLKNPVEFLEMKLELGRGRDLSGFDPDVAKLGPDLYKQVAQAHDVPLRLGIDAQLIRNGPIESIVNRCRHYIAAGAPGGHFFLFLNNIPMDTPPEHVHAAVQAAHVFGRYPLAPDLDEVKFPGMGGFQEFGAFKSDVDWLAG